MAPAPLPPVLPPWARALLQVAPYIAVGLQAALEYIGEMEPGDGASPDEWRRVQLIGGPVAAHAASDKFTTSMDIANITGGGIDNSWTEGDHDAVAGQLGTLCATWAASMCSSFRWYEMRFYRAQFNSYSLAEPFVKAGPPVAIYPLTNVGAVASAQAHQVSITSTDRTAYAKHWGRNYWPHPSAGTVTQPGFVSSATVTALANAVHTCYGALMAAGYFPVVAVTQVDKQPMRGLLTVNEVQVDNLFDVVRRRRPKLPTQRVRLPV